MFNAPEHAFPLKEGYCRICRVLNLWSKSDVHVDQLLHSEISQSLLEQSAGHAFVLFRTAVHGFPQSLFVVMMDRER